MESEQLQEPKDFLSVIVIDDEDEARASYVRLLENVPQFFCAQAFSGGQPALEWMEHNSPPNVVLVDIMMPIMSGIACARAIRTRFVSTKIVIMTGWAQTQLIEASLSLGVEGFLSKPFGKEQLTATLKAVMDSQSVIYAKFCEEINTMAPSDRAGAGVDGDVLWATGSCDS